MLTLISLLGGGGALGAAYFFIPGLREIIGKLLGSIPPWLLWALLAMAAILGAGLWHNHAVGSAHDAGVKEGRTAERKARDAAWQAAFDEMHRGAMLWKDNYQAEADARAQAERNLHAETLRANAALAADLRLRGPGRAAAPGCGPQRDPDLSAAPGGPDPAPAGTDAPAGPLPPGDRPTDSQFAIVPWNWLVDQARDFDDIRSRVNRWESWYGKEKAAHDAALARLRGQFPKPALGTAP